MNMISNLDMEDMKDNQTPQPHQLKEVPAKDFHDIMSEERRYVPGDVGYPPGSKYAPNPANKKATTRQVALDFTDRKPGLKFDGSKPRMDLLDAAWLEEVAKVLTFGAQKYAAHNWRNGITYSRLIAAAYRHLGAINNGEDIDAESGLPHVAHLSCCIMFLSSMMRVKPELDDRYKA